MLHRQKRTDAALRSHGEKMQIAMEEKEKRRIASRNRTEAEIACRPFTSSGPTHTADGVLRNFSEEGSYIVGSGVGPR